MAEYKASKCPFISGVKLGDFGSSPLADNSLYRKLVGILLYLTHSQPDLAYAVGIFSRYMQETNDIRWKASKRILHYVQGTKHFRIYYATSSSLKLVGSIDSYWDGDNNEKNYTLFNLFMVTHGPIFLLI